MLHFKTEFQRKNAIIDGILKIAEDNNLNTNDAVFRLKQSQHGANLRLTEEIDAL